MRILSLEHEVLKDIIEKTLQVTERRELASYAIQEFGLSERQACRTVQVSHATSTASGGRLSILARLISKTFNGG